MLNDLRYAIRALDLSPTDPGTFVAGVAAMSALGLAACYQPARRVMRIDPLLALRNE